MPHPRDTSEAAYSRQVEALRRLAPEQRLAAAAALSEDVRALSEAGVRARHPGYSTSEVARAVAEIFLGRDLGARARRGRVAAAR